ncbi:MAG TPA: N-acetylneuraminate synthase family protein [Desulfomonilaceae bacterium]|nr:N-acetylneuraminate synthase family protein [Desulfomonilaceae bacterium]
MNRAIFDELFVLELANNHWGDIERGLKIVRDFATVVRYNNVRAAIKLQLRNVDTFIHKDFMHRNDLRYIKKTQDTKMSKEHFAVLVEAIRRNGCMRMATAFDEASVDLCVELGIQIIKVSSSDIADWVLLEKIAKTRKPVIVSTGGASVKNLDDMVTFFENRNIELALNHCVSLYPAEDHELQLNQIDFLKTRYPRHIIGLSTHEHNDWTSSIKIAYAKGARTFERHIDLPLGDRPFSPYCSTPDQIDEWFKAYNKAKEMCGHPGDERIQPSKREIDYLNGLVRGVYAARDLDEGDILTEEDIYMAIPLQKGQLSCRELIAGDVLIRPCPKDQPLIIDMFDNPYSRHEGLKKVIMERGVNPS